MTFSFYLMVVVFVVGYMLIALEHPLKIYKTPTALMLCALLWSIAALSGGASFAPTAIIEHLETLGLGLGLTVDNVMAFLGGAEGAETVRGAITTEVLHELGSTSEIIFFLIGAMSIVEVMDSWGAFRIITDRIQAKSKVKLLWVLGTLAFFMSAVLDNLTTTIVMLALLNKIISDKHDRWFFAGMIVVAANAGGAWTPIGDVTTIMLWIGGKVSTGAVIAETFLASLFSVIVPFIILSFILKGEISSEEGQTVDNSPASRVPHSQRLLMLVLGVCLLLFVPIFKTVTHLPPYIGMLFSLGVLWIVTDILRPKESGNPDKQALKTSNVIRKVDFSSILFFLGILMAVGALSVCGHLTLLAQNLDQISMAEPGKYFLIDIIIGVLSSIIDNVPLVAASMNMYDFAQDHYFWELLAYCAGTGGSLLIIGSAAGVAAMGIEKIDFLWYLKHISWVALVGYLAGVLVYILQYSILN